MLGRWNRSCLSVSSAPIQTLFRSQSIYPAWTDLPHALDSRLPPLSVYSWVMLENNSIPEDRSTHDHQGHMYMGRIKAYFVSPCIWPYEIRHCVVFFGKIPGCCKWKRHRFTIKHPISDVSVRLRKKSSRMVSLAISYTRHPNILTQNKTLLYSLFEICYRSIWHQYRLLSCLHHYHRSVIAVRWIIVYQK